MTKRTRLFMRRFYVGFMSFILTLAALIALPYLQEVDTCVIAAITITVAYGWFALVLLVNFTHWRG